MYPHAEIRCRAAKMSSHIPWSRARWDKSAQFPFHSSNNFLGPKIPAAIAPPALHESPPVPDASREISLRTADTEIPKSLSHQNFSISRAQLAETHPSSQQSRYKSNVRACHSLYPTNTHRPDRAHWSL